MSDNVVELKRLIIAKLSRFGTVYRLEYRAGPTPETSDVQAGLYADNHFMGWLAVSFHASKWAEVHIDAELETPIVSPLMLGMHTPPKEPEDEIFLLQAEELVLNLLNQKLAQQLNKSAKDIDLDPEYIEETDGAPDPRAMDPYQRGQRAVEVWHNHGRDDEQLSQLIAIEIFDALDCMGLLLAEFMDENPDVEREDVGEGIRGLVQDTLGAWRDDQG